MNTIDDPLADGTEVTVEHALEWLTEKGVLDLCPEKIGKDYADMEHCTCYQGGESCCCLCGVYPDGYKERIQKTILRKPKRSNND